MSRAPSHPHATAIGAVLRCLVVAVLLSASACGGTAPPPKPDPVFTVAHRQLPPPPVYNRLREVRFPDTLPARDIGGARARLAPLLHFTVSDASLGQVVRLLAGAVRYRSYCASTIANRPVTVDRLGTVDEIGEAIASSAGIRVIIDHENRSISFLTEGTIEPRFFEGSETNVQS